MEIADVNSIYAFIVSWNAVSRGVFLTEYFANLEECMSYLQSWSYDPNQVNLECVHVIPD